MRSTALEARYQAGRDALCAGELSRARTDLLLVLDSEPDHLDALFDLGVACYREDRLEDAESAFRRLLELRPHDARALHHLGLVRRSKNDVLGSLDALWTALKQEPDDGAAWSTFSSIFQQVQFEGDSSDERLLSLLLVLLAREEVDHAALSRQTVGLLRRSPGLDTLLEHADARDDRALASALFDDGKVECLRRLIVRLALERSILPDPGLEYLFTAVRRAAIETLVGSRPSIPFEVIASVARQCYLTGYVWVQTEDEAAMVEWIVDSMVGRRIGSDANDDIRIATLASFVPLYEWERAEQVVSLAAGAGEPILAGLVQQQITEPVQEQHLAALVPSFGEILDETSLLVRQQYEEHPYPRWTTVAYGEPTSVPDVLRAVDAAAWPPASTMAAPEILVAGCGTGKRLVEVARQFAGATITGIDLSLSSLGYAARKADEAGLGEVRLLQADILAMADWPGDFDVVDACGVLHHMNDPFEGWRVLADLVRPGGLMRIGLYSELARAEASAAREFIEAHSFEATPNGIRAARVALYEEYAGLPEAPWRWRDFYSMQECRDLLFHVHERRFTLLHVRDALYQLGLEFLGLELPRVEVRAQFRARFPRPHADLSLGSWHRFETERPDTFTSMYQFWVGKPA